MPDERRSAIREGVRPALLMGEVTPDGRERVALAGVAVDAERIFPSGSDLGEISAALEDAPIAVELGAAPGRSRRLVAALARGCAVILDRPSTFATSLVRRGAPVYVAGSEPAELRAAWYRVENREEDPAADVLREIELADAWIEDADADAGRDLYAPEDGEGADGAILVALGLDADDAKHCARLGAALGGAPFALVGSRRDPRGPGEGMLEDTWMAQGFGLARRAHLGAGRRLDLIVRRPVDGEASRR